MSDNIRIALIEDEEFFIKGLSMTVGKNNRVRFSVFSHHELFAEQYTEPGSANCFDYILVDFWMGDSNTGEAKLASYIRNDLSFNGILLLWSLEPVANICESHLYDGILEKSLFSLNDLLVYKR